MIFSSCCSETAFVVAGNRLVHINLAEHCDNLFRIGGDIAKTALVSVGIAASNWPCISNSSEESSVTDCFGTCINSLTGERNIYCLVTSHNGESAAIVVLFVRHEGYGNNCK